MNDPYEAQRQLQELQQASKIGRGLGGSSLCGRRQHCPCATWRWRSFPRYRRGRHWLRADPGYRNVRSAQHCADAWDRNHPESPRHTHRRASEQRASGREAFGREAAERGGRPAPSRTSRRKPRQVSATNHVPQTSDFRTGSKCALAFRRDLTDRTTRRDSASDQRA